MLASNPHPAPDRRLQKPRTTKICATGHVLHFTYPQLEEIRVALDAKTGELKAAFMAQAEAMGLACHDGNGKPRKRRASKQHPVE